MSVIVGDCVEVMRGMEAESIDAIVTDPPYGIEFMGAKWDTFGKQRNVEYPSNRAAARGPNAYQAGSPFQAWCTEWATEALRALKPGAHIVAFGGTRTYHRLTSGLEDAGFEIRDCLMYLYGSGFPKSLDVSKAIDKAAGAKRTIVAGEMCAALKRGEPCPGHNNKRYGKTVHAPTTAPATDEAAKWAGWGTALKPGWEPIVLARKPFAGTIAANVLAHGTGALNIEASRIESPDADLTKVQRQQAEGSGVAVGKGYVGAILGKEIPMYKPGGRWPANVLLDEDAAAMLDEQSGVLHSQNPATRNRSTAIDAPGVLGFRRGAEVNYGDVGGASRFFYTAKASRSEREAWGRLKLDPARRSDGRAKDIENPRLRTSERVNDHPTVKPLALMEWLIKLVTPPGGVVLDPFAGSGSTLVAARRLNIEAIGIEQDERSAEIARQRIAAQWEVKLL